MILYPAIDVYEGRCVRLKRGAYEEMTVYHEDPAAMAVAFRDAGATHLHMVDLEGAKTGEMPNFQIIARAVSESGLIAQVGGGVRTEEAVRRYLDAGVHRVILGTAAAREPDFLREMLDQFGAQIAVGVDIKGGYVATHGWTKTTTETLDEAFLRLDQLGVRTVILTDISRDGMLAGPNRAMYAALGRTSSIDIIASGGVSTKDDLRALAALGIHGAILGKALYENKITLEDALCAAGGDA
jgi:phosphoribosylformimino-5-aminoimidazole carboxamide ribotide isomerase